MIISTSSDKLHQGRPYGYQDKMPSSGFKIGAHGALQFAIGAG